MLHLAAATEALWVERAKGAIPAILLDHAHCEKKAASAALSLLFRYPEVEALVLPMSRLAREELAHFEQVLAHLEKRGIRFTRQRPSAYAGKLQEVVRQSEPQRLLDTLLVCGFIEARSCERMKLLAEALPDAELRELYRGLLTAEARHHQLFLDLARGLPQFSREQVDQRIEEIARFEARLVTGAEDEPRMHS